MSRSDPVTSHGVAKKEGISEEEIGATQSIVMAVAGGRVNAGE